MCTRANRSKPVRKPHQNVALIAIYEISRKIVAKFTSIALRGFN